MIFRRNGFAAVVCALALLARVLMPVALHVSVSFSATAVIDGIVAMEICTSQSLHKPADDAPSRPADPAHDHCPACALGKVLALVALLGVILIVSPPRRARSLAWPELRLLPGHLRQGRVRSRGPPLFA